MVSRMEFARIRQWPRAKKNVWWVQLCDFDIAHYRCLSMCAHTPIGNGPNMAFAFVRFRVVFFFSSCHPFWRNRQEPGRENSAIGEIPPTCCARFSPVWVELWPGVKIFLSPAVGSRKFSGNWNESHQLAYIHTAVAGNVCFVGAIGWETSWWDDLVSWEQ